MHVVSAHASGGAAGGGVAGAGRVRYSRYSLSAKSTGTPRSSEAAVRFVKTFLRFVNTFLHRSIWVSTFACGSVAVTRSCR